jgi:hypothetical protein
MLASKKELQDIEKQHDNSVIMSDQLKEMLIGLEDSVENVFVTQSNFIYLFELENFFKTKFISYESLGKEAVLEFICKPEALSCVHNRKFKRISIEYNADFMFEIENLDKIKSSFKIKHISNDNYLVELRLSGV